MVTYDVFRCLSDPIRCSLLELLSQSELSVNELASHFEVSRPAVSRHLRVLRDVGLVSETRAGRERIYRLEPGSLAPGMDWIQRVEAGEIERGGEETVPTGDSDSDGFPEREQAPPRAEWRQW